MTTTPSLGTYKKGLGKGGRARLLLAKKEGGSVRIGSKTYSYSKKRQLIGDDKELKFFDTATNFTVDATGEVPATGQLCLIPQGVTDSTRVGRKCVIRSLQYKWILLFSPAGSATATTTVTIMIVLDRQANGAAAGVNDILTTTVIPTAMINLSNSQRFKVLRRINVTLTAQAGVTTAYNASSGLVEGYMTCNVPLEFSSTTGAITEIKSNNIFLVAGSDGNSDDSVSVLGNVRLRFVG